MRRSWICDWFVLGDYYGGRIALLIILFILLWCAPMAGLNNEEAGWALSVCVGAPILVIILEGVIQEFANKRIVTQNFGRLFLESTVLVLVLYLANKVGLFEIIYAAGFTLAVWLIELCTGYIKD